MPSVNEKSYFFFSSLSAFNGFFFWLILLAGLFAAMPNRRGENGHPSLTSDLCRRHPHLSPLSVTLMVISCASTGWGNSLTFLFCGWFLFMNGCWSLSITFSVYWDESPSEYHLFPARTLTDRKCKTKCKWWVSLFLDQWISALTWGLLSSFLASTDVVLKYVHTLFDPPCVKGEA